MVLALRLFGLVLLVKQASLLFSPIGASHEEFKAAHPNGLFGEPGEFPYQIYMFVINGKVCNESKCSYEGSECGGAIANEVDDALVDV